jgi:hypothetical protein
LATKNLKEDRIDKDIIDYVHTDLKTKIFEELLDKTEAEDYVKQ